MNTILKEAITLLSGEVVMADVDSNNTIKANNGEYYNYITIKESNGTEHSVLVRYCASFWAECSISEVLELIK